MERNVRITYSRRRKRLGLFWRLPSAPSQIRKIVTTLRKLGTKSANSAPRTQASNLKRAKRHDRSVPISFSSKANSIPVREFNCDRPYESLAMRRPPKARLHRSRGKDSAALKQPFWPQGVKYVFGTRWLRTVQSLVGGADGIRTHDLLDAIECAPNCATAPPQEFSVYHIQRRSNSIAPALAPAGQCNPLPSLQVLFLRPHFSSRS